jgi:polyphosphate kinase 2 (PPK2 family)
LRAELLNAQYDLKLNGRFPVLILIAGVEGAGKGETVNLLNEWMDPRHIQTTAFGTPSDEEGGAPRALALLARIAAQGAHRHLLSAPGTPSPSCSA